MLTLVIAGRIIELHNLKDNYMITNHKEKRKDKEVVVFNRRNYIKNPKSALMEAKLYSDWLAYL
jgi:hypothetical protein